MTRGFIALIIGLFALCGCDRAELELVAQSCTGPDAGAYPVHTHEFGKITAGTGAQGEEVRAVVVVRNDGPEAMSITDAVPTCACTHAEFEFGLLEPGESRELVATVGIRKLGNLREAIILLDGDRPVLRVNLVGVVVAGQSIWCDHHQVRALGAAHPTRVIVSVLAAGHEPPGMPRAQPPAGVDVDFSPWQLVYGPSRENLQLSRWQSIALVRANDPHDSSGTIEVSVEGYADPAKVIVTSAPM